MVKRVNIPRRFVPSTELTVLSVHNRGAIKSTLITIVLSRRIHTSAAYTWFVKIAFVQEVGVYI